MSHTFRRLTVLAPAVRRRRPPSRALCLALGVWLVVLARRRLRAARRPLPEAARRAEPRGRAARRCPRPSSNEPGLSRLPRVHASRCGPTAATCVREQVGASEFYDFGALAPASRASSSSPAGAMRRGATRRAATCARCAAGHAGGDLHARAEVEALRGPFRMIGHLRRQRRSRNAAPGIAWRLRADARCRDAARTSSSKRPQRQALVALDAQFEGAPETLRVLRPGHAAQASARLPLDSTHGKPAHRARQPSRRLGERAELRARESRRCPSPPRARCW